MTEGMVDLSCIDFVQDKRKVNLVLALKDSLCGYWNAHVSYSIIYNNHIDRLSLSVQLKINKKYIHNGVFIYKEECNCDICWKMDGTGDHHAN